MIYDGIRCVLRHANYFFLCFLEIKFNGVRLSDISCNPKPYINFRGMEYLDLVAAFVHKTTEQNTWIESFR